LPPGKKGCLVNVGEGGYVGYRGDADIERSGYQQKGQPPKGFRTHVLTLVRFPRCTCVAANDKCLPSMNCAFSQDPNFPAEKFHQDSNPFRLENSTKVHVTQVNVTPRM
jgi:hypothetical protein